MSNYLKTAVFFILIFNFNNSYAQEKKISEENLAKAKAEYKLSGSAFKQGNPKLALEHIKKAIALDPGNSQYLGSAGNMEINLNLIDDAKAHYLAALAIDTAKSNGTHPKIPYYMFRIAGIELVKTNFDGAISLLEGVILHDKKATPPNKSRILSSNILLARAWEGKADYEKALNYYEMSLEDLKSSDQSDNPSIKSLTEKISSEIDQLRNKIKVDATK